MNNEDVAVIKRTPLYRLLQSINVPDAALASMTKHVNKLRHLADDIRSTTGLTPRPTSFEVCVEGCVHDTYVPTDGDADEDALNRGRGWRYDYLDASGTLALVDVTFEVLGDDDPTNPQMVLFVIPADSDDDDVVVEPHVTLAARFDGERHGAFRNADEDPFGGRPCNWSDEQMHRDQHVNESCPCQQDHDGDDDSTEKYDAETADQYDTLSAVEKRAYHEVFFNEATRRLHPEELKKLMRLVRYRREQERLMTEEE